MLNILIKYRPHYYDGKEAEDLGRFDSLKEAQTQPEFIAARALNQAVYGAHPYALQPSGDIASVATLTVQDLNNFYHTHYNARRAVVALMGDVTRIQAEAIAQQLTGELPVSAETLLLPEVQMNIKRLMDIACYRGVRHRKGLPLRGQRTRTNSRTVRGNVRKTAGSGKRKVDLK